VTTSASIQVVNTGSTSATFNLVVNDNALFVRNADIIAAIQNTPTFQTNGFAFATWDWMMDQTYHWHPYTEAKWQHAPYLFLNSMGFGYCDDVANIFTILMSQAGYQARVWGIEGHVISEAFVDGAWRIYDVDLGALYVDSSGAIQGYDYILNNNVDFAANYANSSYAWASQPKPWAFQASVLDLYRTTENNQSGGPQQLPDYTGAHALILPAGAVLTVHDAPGTVASMYEHLVPELSVLKVSFGAITGFTFRYPLVPISISGTGTVAIDGVTYVLGSAELEARFADRARPVTQLTVNTTGGDNVITYMLNPERFSLEGSISAGLKDAAGVLLLTINGTGSADHLTGTGGAESLVGGAGDDTLTQVSSLSGKGGWSMLGGDGSDLLRVLDKGTGVGIRGDGIITLDGGAGADRFILEGTQLNMSGSAKLDGGSGFDTLVWNGSYNLTAGGRQNSSVGLYDGQYVQAIDARNLERIDLASAGVTGLSLAFTAADVFALTQGSDFDRSALGRGLTGQGGVLFLDAGSNAVDMAGWTLLGPTTMGSLSYQLAQQGDALLALRIDGRVLNGTAAAEALTGLTGDDVISGGGGADTLTGGWGDDQIRQTAPEANAAAGSRLDGGQGSDTLIFEGVQAYTSTYLRMNGGDGDDLIRVGGQRQDIGAVQVDGGSGDDVITLSRIAGGRGGLGYADGGDGRDLIQVRDGIWGNALFRLRGGAGDDRFTIAGGAIATRSDYTAQVDGGAGFDVLVWNGTYNLTVGGRQNPAVGLAGGHAQQVQLRSIERIDLISAASTDWRCGSTRPMSPPSPAAATSRGRRSA
jgi:Ca2+-binding RTX toxin-like protein